MAAQIHRVKSILHVEHNQNQDEGKHSGICTGNYGTGDGGEYLQLKIIKKNNKKKQFVGN